MAIISNNQLILTSGATLEADQIKSICTGAAGNRATDAQIKEYLNDEGWAIEDIEEFIEVINSDMINELNS